MLVVIIMLAPIFVNGQKNSSNDEKTKNDSIFLKYLSESRKEFQGQRNEVPNRNKPLTMPSMTPEGSLGNVSKKDLEMILLAYNQVVGEIPLKIYLKKFKGDSLRIMEPIIGQTQSAADMTAFQILREAGVYSTNSERIFTFTRVNRWNQVVMIKVLTKREFEKFK